MVPVEKSQRKYGRIQKKLEVGFTFLTLVVLGLLTVSLFAAARIQMRQHVRKRLRDVVAVAALQIDGDMHATLSDRSHEGNIVYSNIKRTLQQIRDSGEDFQYVYTWRFDDKGQLVFVVDAETDPEEISHLGDIYEDADEKLVAMLSSMAGPEVDKEFITDQWGTFLSGYAPFFRSDGTQEGIIGVDIEASVIRANERQFLWVAFSIFCLGTPLALLLGRFFGKKIATPLVNMTEAAEQIKQGRGDTRLDINTNDELELLAASFNVMAEEITRHRSGLEKLVDERTTELKDSNEKLQCEISERQEIEQKIIGAKQEWERTFDAVPDMIAIIGKDHKILRVNRAMAEKLGSEPAELAGKMCYEYIHQEDHPAALCPHSRFLDDKQPHLEETFLESLGGHCDMRISPVYDSNGECIGSVHVIRDINDKKDAEDKLKESEARANMMAEQAQAANEAKSEFLANMSHEIRTPLNGIIGFSDFLAGEHLTEDQKESMRIVGDCGRNLLDLINDVLDFSKIEAGQMDVEAVDCDLGKLLGEIESVMRLTAEQKGLDFAITTSEDVPSMIRIDPLRLKQCLLNLLSNAVKFTGQGKVHANIFLQTTGDTEQICFAVEDTGIGIPSEMQEEIFESFTQADKTVAKKYGGTGLGLAITKRLASLLGGDLSLASRQGEGSTFTLTVPVTEAHVQSPPSDHDTDGKAEDFFPTDLSGNILVVEDTFASQKLLRILLEKLGLTVTIVEDGSDAVKAVDENDYDIIFMDIRLPIMNGYEATTAIRQKGVDVPIVAITANAIKGDRERCFQAGCDDYLAKPFDRATLVKTVCRHLPVTVSGNSEK